MSFDTEACGARIRELRKGKKLTQEKLAEELNITDSHHRRIESGIRTGSIDLLIDIAAYFEVSMDYLLLRKVDQSGKARAELRESDPPAPILTRYVNLCDKYTLTIEEAAAYFGIGQKKIRSLVQTHGNDDFILHVE